MKDLDYTYYDTWFRRECNMMYDTYQEYLNSEWWEAVKLKALKRSAYKRCQFCDTTNNTPARIDRNELYVDIAIEPVKAVEFIYIPVRIQNTGTISGGGAAAA